MCTELRPAAARLRIPLRAAGAHLGHAIPAAVLEAPLSLVRVNPNGEVERRPIAVTASGHCPLHPVVTLEGDVLELAGGKLRYRIDELGNEHIVLVAVPPAAALAAHDTASLVAELKKRGLRAVAA